MSKPIPSDPVEMVAMTAETAVMPVRDQVVFSLLFLVFFFSLTRGIMGNIGEYYLTKSQKKRRKQGQTFREWLTLARYRQEIPRYLILFYFFIIIIHLLLVLYVLVACFIESLQQLGGDLVRGLILFDAGWTLLILVISYRHGSPFLHYERWIPRPEENKKGKSKGKGRGRRRNK